MADQDDIVVMVQWRAAGVAVSKGDVRVVTGFCCRDLQQLVREVDAIHLVAKFSGEGRQAAGTASQVGDPGR